MAEPTPVVNQRGPRLWRVVGGLGKVLIGAGVLTLLFVAYQLWGTGLQYSRSQDDLRTEFQRASATTVPAATTTTATTNPAPTTTPPTTNPASTTTPAPTGTTTLPAAPVSEGDVLARMEIPRIGTSAYVVAGVSVADLRRGPGHFPQTALPGQLGNAAVAGHRTTYGAPFARINELETNDEVVITTREGARYVYRVSEAPFVVPASGVDVLADTPGQATLTLVSCDPKYTARSRIVVKSTLEEAASAPPEDRTAPYTTEPVPAEETPTSAGTGEPSAVTTAPSPTVLTDGWFSDSGAWTGLALWGIPLVVLGVGSWAIGRRTRRWFVPLVAVAPGLVLLYFFFENLNRLMPANL